MDWVYRFVFELKLGIFTEDSDIPAGSGGRLKRLLMGVFGPAPEKNAFFSVI
jgi:hypothetical protein